MWHILDEWGQGRSRGLLGCAMRIKSVNTAQGCSAVLFVKSLLSLHDLPRTWEHPSQNTSRKVTVVARLDTLKGGVLLRSRLGQEIDLIGIHGWHVRVSGGGKRHDTMVFVPIS